MLSHNTPERYRLVFKARAVKYLDRLERKVHDKILFQLLKISLGLDSSLDIKRMGWSDDLYRLRIGDLRVIYQKDGDRMVIIVLKVWPRGDVYDA